MNKEEIKIAEKIINLLEENKIDIIDISLKYQTSGNLIIECIIPNKKDKILKDTPK